jgi:dethiobiotin synthetase
MLKGIFVAGTDTGVGKTLVACALLRALRKRGVDAVGFKPVVTGVENGRWEDADALHEACDACADPALIAPQRFQAPMSPVPAAKCENKRVDLGASRKAFASLRARHATVVVEGIGGLLVPLDEKTLQLDFIREAGFPVVLAARAGLGTINHTLLSAQALGQAGLKLAGVVLSVTQAADANNLRPSIEEIERHGPRVKVVLDFLPETLTRAQRTLQAAQRLDYLALELLENT